MGVHRNGRGWRAWLDGPVGQFDTREEALDAYQAARREREAEAALDAESAEAQWFAVEFSERVQGLKFVWADFEDAAMDGMLGMAGAQAVALSVQARDCAVFLAGRPESVRGGEQALGLTPSPLPLTSARAGSAGGSEGAPPTESDSP